MNKAQKILNILYHNEDMIAVGGKVVSSPIFRVMPNETGVEDSYSHVIKTSNYKDIVGYYNKNAGIFKPINTRNGMVVQGSVDKIYSSIKKTIEELEN